MSRSDGDYLEHLADIREIIIFIFLTSFIGFYVILLETDVAAEIVTDRPAKRAVYQEATELLHRTR